MNDFSNSFSRRARNGNERLVSPRGIRQGGSLRDWTCHLDSTDVRIPLGALVIDEADHFHPQLWPMLDFASQRLASIPGADDEHALWLHSLAVGRPVVIAAQTHKHPGAEEDKQRESPVD